MRPQSFSTLALLILFLSVNLRPRAATPQPSPGDRILAEYFKAETDKLERACLADLSTLEDWQTRREGYRLQLLEMLGLLPLPPRTPLNPVVTGAADHPSFTVEKIHFQSMPGLYVTGNLYLPKTRPGPLPAILYLCGHANVITNGVSFGNKTGYQHHGAWFAQHGYVCFTIDTIQLGEIQGIHHGTHREGMWWWNARGYTPAGVEAWNSMRALDYLASRPEVDPQRLGVTGRSGGGAYSWWLAALDDRIKAAAPVAGITDLHNHVVDGVVEGHCDCMFLVNTYRWDYPLVAALVAPRPLLIANSDKDSIFPLSGVVRLHSKAASVYQLHGKQDALGLLITEGPHKDTQDLQLPVFRWFNRHLKGEDPPIEKAAQKLFTPAQLKVFDHNPADERTSRIHESFTPIAPPPRIPADKTDWRAQTDSWRQTLAEKVFAGWPKHGGNLDLRLVPPQSENNPAQPGQHFEFSSQHPFRLPLFVIPPASPQSPSRVEIFVLDQRGWDAWIRDDGRLFAEGSERRASSPTESPSPVFNSFDSSQTKSSDGAAKVFFPPRGIGPTAWDPSPRKQIQNRRRFMLLGQTLDAMRVWDIRRAIQAVQTIPSLRNLPITVTAEDAMAANCLYAALFEPSVARLDLANLPASHRHGPDYLNVLRFLDLPEAVAMAGEQCPIQLRQPQDPAWDFPIQTLAKLGIPQRLTFASPRGAR